MFNFLERLAGQKPVCLPDSLKASNFLAMGAAAKKILKQQVKNNSGIVDVLVHPYFREDDLEGKYPFPLTAEYTLSRDLYITNTIEVGKPLIIFEEAAKCATLQEKIKAKRGFVYWVATCDGDSTPTLVKEDPSYLDFMNSRVRARLERQVWDVVRDELRSVGIKRLNVGGRYMVLHKATTDHGQIFLDDLKKLAKGKRNAKEIVDRDLIPGACPGKFMVKMLHRGFDISLSEISSPTNTLTPTDLRDHPEMIGFY